MHEKNLKPAMLSKADLDKVKALESKLGDDVIVVAYAKEEDPADLEPKDIEQLKAVEKEMGNVYLVAWKRPN
jgi:hypothetical protein